MSLDPGREGWPPAGPPLELPRRRKKPVKEPVWDVYEEKEYGYYAEEHDDFREPLPEREGLAIRAARAVAAAWERIWRRKKGSLARFLLVATAAFAAGVLLESQVHFLSWAAEILAAAALVMREWVNPGVQTALLFTGLITVTGVWLLRRVIGNPRSASPVRRRVTIHRDVYDRHL